MRRVAWAALLLPALLASVAVAQEPPPRHGDLGDGRHEHRDVEPAEDLPRGEQTEDRGEAGPAEVGAGRRHWSFLRIFHSPSTRPANSAVARTSPG